MHEVVVFSGKANVLFSGREVSRRNPLACNLGFFNLLAGPILHLSGANLCATPPLGGEL
jgi:hypothetical protein